VWVISPIIGKALTCGAPPSISSVIANTCRVGDSAENQHQNTPDRCPNAEIEIIRKL
jgi:hypothetical protein